MSIKKRIVLCAIVAVAFVFVVIAGCHWFAKAPWPLATALTGLSFALMLVQFYLMTGFAAALRKGKYGSVIAAILLGATVAGFEGGVLYEPFSGVVEIVIPKPVVTIDTGMIDAKIADLSGVEEKLLRARATRDAGAAQAAITEAFALTENADLLDAYGEALNDNAYGPVTQNAIADALTLVMADSQTASGDLRRGLQQEAELRAWLIWPLIAVSVALAFELLARFAFAPWLEEKEGVQPVTRASDRQTWTYKDYLNGLVPEIEGFRIIAEPPSERYAAGRVRHHPILKAVS